MTEETIKVPDIGGEGEIIEVCVKVGDTVTAEDSLVVLESDKASMEVPAPLSGKIVKILVKEGDRLKENDSLLVLDSATEPSKKTTPKQSKAASETKEKKAVEPVKASETETPVSSSPVSVVKQVFVPDVGADNVPVIDISVKEGDTVKKDDGLLTLESDKASMEIPSPFDGKIVSLKVKEGDEIGNGQLVLEMEVDEDAAARPVSDIPAKAPEETEPEKTVDEVPASPSAAITTQAATPAKTVDSCEQGNSQIHAGPAVRKLAREFGVDLTQVRGTGAKNRIVKEDVQSFVSGRLKTASSGSASGLGIPAVPEIDFSKWGEVEEKPLNRLRQIAAQNFQRSWLNVPHVTQFDEADITELEEFRQVQKEKALAKGVRLTPLPFLLKACGYVLEAMPQFCASLHPQGDKIIYKKYINVGVAVDTPDGLLVPVIKNINKKGLYELAVECVEMAAKAKNKQLKPDEMQGGCFTVSSLGSIGGTAFTPIVNAPEVAILGISKAAHKPLWNGSEFKPRLMLPLALSYDHRAINGADAAKFTTMLHELLSDIRRLLL